MAEAHAAAAHFAAPPGLPEQEGDPTGTGATASRGKGQKNARDEHTDGMPDRQSDVWEQVEEDMQEGALLSFDTLQSLIIAQSNWSARKWKSVRDIYEWKEVQQQMELLGYEITHEDAWRKMGVCKMEGPNPTADHIRNRRIIATQFIRLIKESTKWTVNDREQAKELEDNIVEASKKCLKELKQVQGLRKKAIGRGMGFARWAEPSNLLLNWIEADEAERWIETRVALFASDLAGRECKGQISWSDTILSPTRTWKVYGEIGANTLQTIQELAGNTLYLWAPRFAELEKIMDTLNRIAQETTVQFNIKWVCPFFPLPGVTEAKHVEELWGNTIMMPKYKDLVKSVKFLMQPTTCVAEGRDVPIHRESSIAIIQTATGGTQSPSTAIDWLRYEGSARQNIQIWITLPKDRAWQAWRTLQGRKEDEIEAWLRPKRSPISEEDNPRSLIIGMYTNDAVHAQAVVRNLKKVPQLDGALMGHTGMLADEDTLMAWYGSITALDDAADLIQMVIPLPGKKAIFTTAFDKQEEWERRLTKQHFETPVEAIKKITTRDGVQVEKFYARPLIPAEQIVEDRRKAKARAKGNRNDTRVWIAIKRVQPEREAALWAHVIQWIAERSGLEITKEGNAPKKGGAEWKWAEDGNDRNGAHSKIELKPQTQTDSRKLVAKLHGTSIRLDGEYRLLTITTDVTGCDWSGQESLLPCNGEEDAGGEERCP